MCPFGAIKVEEKKAVIDLSKCNLCGACVDACKLEAIELKKETAAKRGTGRRSNDVWVFCEQKKNVIQSISWELLAKGRELADKLGMKLAGVFEALLAGWKEQGYELVSLAQYQEGLNRDTLPRHEVVIGEIPGRSGTLALQGEEFLSQ